MGRLFVVELDGLTYRCKFCLTSLALVDDILSRAFSCRQGKAYLFENAVNVSVGPEENRLMMSGMHTVADVFCCGCGQLLGWKYMMARDKTQKYKEGKVVLERWRITKDSIEDFTCQWCYVQGHTLSDCPTFKALYPDIQIPCYTRNAPSQADPTELVSESHSSPWLLDSGALHHVTTDLADPSLHYPHDGTDEIVIGGGSGLPISNAGC